MQVSTAPASCRISPWVMTRATNPLLCIQRGGNFSLRAANQTSDSDYGGSGFTPNIPLRSPELLTGRNLFHTHARRLVRQMECPEHWCEQNDDTAISIIALACARVIIIDFYGVCEETDKSS